MHTLHVAEDVPAQIEHDLLPRPLHQVSLKKFKCIGDKQRPQVDCCQLGYSGHRVSAQAASEPVVGANVRDGQFVRKTGIRGGGHITVNGHHDQVGTGYVADCLERD